MRTVMWRLLAKTSSKRQGPCYLLFAHENIQNRRELPKKVLYAVKPRYGYGDSGGLYGGQNHRLYGIKQFILCSLGKHEESTKHVCCNENGHGIWEYKIEVTFLCQMPLGNLGCVSLSLKSGNSPFWEAQGGGFLSLKWPHNLKYNFFASWWTGADLAPGHLLVKNIQFLVQFLLFLRYGNPHLCPSGSPLNLSETHPSLLTWAKYM